MRTATCFHQNNCRGMRDHKVQETLPRQLLSKIEIARHGRTMDLETRFFQIHADHCIFLFAVLSDW